MTKKKCIKLIMGTMGLPQPRGAEMVFLGLREIMHKKQKAQPSNKDVLVALLAEMEKAGPECGVSVVGGLLAAVQRRIIETKTAIIHDRLMGGPAKAAALKPGRRLLQNRAQLTYYNSAWLSCRKRLPPNGPRGAVWAACIGVISRSILPHKKKRSEQHENYQKAIHP